MFLNLASLAFRLALVVLIVLGILWAIFDALFMHRFIVLMSDHSAVRYKRAAVATLSMKALLSFKRRETPRGHKLWNPEDTPCVKLTSRSYEIDGPVRKLKGLWPLGASVSCSDFFVTAIGSPEDPSDYPPSCRPVLTQVHFPPDNSYDVVLAVAHDEQITKHPELDRGSLSAAEKTQILANVDYRDSAVIRLIESGGFDSILIERESRQRCTGFDLYRYNVALNNRRVLLQNVPLSWK